MSIVWIQGVHLEIGEFIMADISKIGAGQTGKIYSNLKKTSEKETSKSDISARNEKSTAFKGVSADDILNTMALAGMQNQIQHGIKTVDPTKYLSQERISAIAGSMVTFMGKTDEMKNSLDEEFGHLPEYKGIPEDKKYEMAAEAFVRMES